MNVIDSLKWRYAIKKFNSSVSISEKQIEILKEAFSLTASSFGLQPIKMIVIQNRETRKKLVKYAYGQEQIVNASHLLIICIQKNFSSEDIEEYFSLLKKIRNTPGEIIEPFKKDILELFSKKTTEDIRQSSKNQAYLALGNLLTVCAVSKIDSCPMEGFDSEKFDKFLNLNSKNLQSVLLMPVGKRSNDDYMSTLKKVRKPIENIILEM